jgi:hypothetical protein
MVGSDGAVAVTGPPGVGRGDGSGGRAGAVPASGTGADGVLEHPSSSAATPAATPTDRVSRFFALKTKTTLRIS